MIKCNLELKHPKYKIYFYSNINILLLKFKKIINQKNFYKYNIVIITNRLIDFLYYSYFYSYFYKFKYINKYIIQDGEKYKNLNTINKIINFLLINNYTKKSLLISLGGGVISDITGFVASIYQRGIYYINIPTTLLSQIDASIGGKTGINHKMGKNLIGTINQPLSILINISFLKTLPYRQIITGMGEMIKYSILNKSFYIWLKKNIKNIISLNINKLLYSIYFCCRIKNNYIIKDEYENNNIRILLNLGHTFAHAIEVFYNYSNIYLHGEAVSLGIIISLYISNLLNMISKKKIKEIINLMKLSLLPIKLPKNMLINDYLFFMKKDKKNIERNKITLIIPKDIGSCIIYYNISEEIIKEAINLINKNYL